MSLSPITEFFSRPSRILNQHFGLDLVPEDLMTPFMVSNEPSRFRHLMSYPFVYNRPWQSVASVRDTGSVVSFDKDKFQVNLDVQQFAPEEISVKVTGDHVTVEGKHEEKQDEHGFISRHFVRKYTVPKGHDVGKIESKLSSDGILTVIAPKSNSPDSDHRSIPIVRTGQPMKTIEKKQEKQEKKEKAVESKMES